MIPIVSGMKMTGFHVNVDVDQKKPGTGIREVATFKEVQEDSSKFLIKIEMVYSPFLSSTTPSVKQTQT